ncbi:MAG: hypothetical protein ISR62_01505 [Desulfobacteraceae bacterium]|nr:hypothetical protein [Desulfobacterales bacterium]MBL6967083.1 hypothetical protein [Desulfobacteraceae bacterium]MBL7171753.1 hypothetical protein [Desulfobacteraceae bacterium]
MVAINRVKPHTAFRGEVESGLCKMLAVGLGKQKGASMIHKFGLDRVIVPAAQRIIEKISILCGIAVLENPNDQIHTVQLAPPEACLEDLRNRGGVIIDNEPAPLRFDDQGRLKPVRMCESS